MSDLLKMATADILAILGLVLNLIAAILLAYDVIYGPGARFQAGMARLRLANARQWREEHERNTRALPTPPYSPEESERILRDEIPPLRAREQEEEVRLKGYEAHEARAQMWALVALGLLFLGFALQLVSTVIQAVGSRNLPVRPATTSCVGSLDANTLAKRV
ncbi:MAG TPA: hypothetical protein VGX03_16715 [Candidatus Binatia bacterium]|jgi:hypothetical protein|nr:hypothetical protein [Candidatus Binatia bacterium]